MRRRALTAGVLLWVVPCPAAAIFVDSGAPGANDGSSWRDAFHHLQDALSVATAGSEIRVAEGVYRPDRGTHQQPGDREATFRLVDGVTLLGGFAGFGRADPDSRDVVRYETVLSGDLSGDDGPDFAQNDENSYHVVVSANVEDGVVGETSGVLDGFTIRGGNANGSSARGGGLLCTSDLSVRDCVVTENWAQVGGGVYCGPSSCCVTEPALIRCALVRNEAGEDGGGIYVGDADVRFEGCSIRYNAATEDGGGLMFGNDNFSTIVNCVIDSNTAGSEGGGFYCRYCFRWTMVNCTVSGNWAGQGGGLFLEYDVHQTLRNSIFWDNSPDEIFVADLAEPPVVEFCCIQGGWSEAGAVGVTDADPRFVDADGEDFHLRPDSPCVDAGTAEGAPEQDAEGNPRPCGEGVDLGAYEECPPLFRRGDSNADGELNISDVVLPLWLLFCLGCGPESPCVKAADVDDSGVVNITDPIYLLSWLFLGGPAPPAPGPSTCGPDLSEDSITCLSYPPCE